MEDIDEALEFFETDIALDKKGRAKKKERDVNVSKLEKVAQSEGLTGPQIERLVDIAGSGVLPETVSNKLIRCLIPRGSLPVKAALAAVSWMCTNKPSSNVQTYLVRWLLLIYELIDYKDNFHSIYGILFYFLENDIMSSHVGHLLYLLTRKEDVVLFRVRALLNLQARVGSQPHILGLLSLFKLYCPTLVALSLSRNKVFFRQTDRVWASHISKVQERWRDVSGTENYSYSQVVDASTLSAEPRNKRRRISLIPESQPATTLVSKSSRKLQFDSWGEVGPIPVEQTKSFKDLLKNIHRIEMPSQMASVLKNAHLQHVVSLCPDPVAPQRLSYWLHHVLHEEFLNQPKESKRENREQLLKALNQFSDFIEEGIPVCENFLMSYLHVWNGADHRANLLRLITRIRLQPFSVLSDLILEPLRKLYFSSTVFFKCQVIWTLTTLVKNFALVEWPRYKETLRLQKAMENIAETTLEEPNYASVFLGDVEKFNGLETVSELVSFVDHLCSMGLQAESGHCLLMHCALNFYDLVPVLQYEYGLPVVVLPSLVVFCRALCSNSADVLSRLLDLICRYRSAFESLRNSQPSDKLHRNCKSQSLERIPVLNDYTTDASDAIWRYKIFTKVPHNTMFLLGDMGELEQLGLVQINSRLCLYEHQALLGFVWFFLKEHVRDEYMEYLSMRNVKAIQKFVKTCIRRTSSKH